MMTRVSGFLLVSAGALFLAGGCVVPTRGGGFRVIAPVPHPTHVGVATVRIPPPPVPRVHVARPPVPHPGHIWIEGHHVLQGGRYVWKAGYWAVPPRPGAVWVPPRTVKVGVEWHHTPGYWK